MPGIGFTATTDPDIQILGRIQKCKERIEQLERRHPQPIIYVTLSPVDVADEGAIRFGDNGTKRGLLAYLSGVWRQLPMA